MRVPNLHRVGLRRPEDGYVRIGDWDYFELAIDDRIQTDDRTLMWCSSRARALHSYIPLCCCGWVRCRGLRINTSQHILRLYVNLYAAGVPCPRANDHFCDGNACNCNEGTCESPGLTIQSVLPEGTVVVTIYIITILGYSTATIYILIARSTSSCSYQ